MKIELSKVQARKTESLKDAFEEKLVVPGDVVLYQETVYIIVESVNVEFAKPSDGTTVTMVKLSTGHFYRLEGYAPFKKLEGAFVERGAK